MSNKSLIERIKAVAGQDFDSYGCRVRNPHITARQSIEIADYIVELEKERDELAAQVERLRIAAIESQDWNWLTAKEYAEDVGDDFFEIEDIQRLWDLVRSETPPAALEAMKSHWQTEIITELKNHMMNNGYSDEADGVGAWFDERH